MIFCRFCRQNYGFAHFHPKIKKIRKHWMTIIHTNINEWQCRRRGWSRLDKTPNYINSAQLYSINSTALKLCSRSALLRHATSEITLRQSPRAVLHKLWRFIRPLKKRLKNTMFTCTGYVLICILRAPIIGEVLFCLCVLSTHSL